MKLNLPRKYEIKENTPKKFHKYKGVPKLSYSQIESFNNPLYFDQYVLNYLYVIRDEGNVFSKFGSACGEYIEHRGKGEHPDLSEKDKSVLDSILEEIPENAEFEKEVIYEVYDKKGNLLFILQGFVDIYLQKEKKSYVSDLKTGSLAKHKDEFYQSREYNQTNQYCEALVQEGEKIERSWVIFADRAHDWNPDKKECENLRLSGVVKTIETPYSKEKMEKFLEKINKTAIEVSKLKTTFDKLKLLEI